MSKNGSKKRWGVFERVKGSDIWSICYFDAQGRRHREVIGSKQDAIDAHQDRRAEIRKGRQFPKNIRGVLVSELMEDLFQKYTRNSKDDHHARAFRWELHLRPFFAHVRAAHVDTELLNQYVDRRRREKKLPSNATINRELATLRAALNLGRKASPPKVFQVPPFSMLKEQNIRKGFVRDEQYHRLAQECTTVGLWLRALLGVAYNYGWRRGELLHLRVRQVDLAARTVDLEPGSTKNDDARIVVMTQEVYELLRACIRHKGPDDFVFTREDGSKIGDFRKVWQNVCTRAGVGHLVCRRCGQEMKKSKCEKCGNRTAHYVGLILHDLRRTSCRNMRRLGISEKTIMKICGWKSNAVFQRYNIVDQADLADAARRLDEKRMKGPTGRTRKAPKNRSNRVSALRRESHLTESFRMGPKSATKSAHPN